jgi:guanylate kinase
LSRSWTTRAPRRGEPLDAYVFVDRAAFENAIAGHRFLEWAEFLGQLYGTPDPELHPGEDLLLEIDSQGAVQVTKKYPDAVVILLMPPSPEVQAERLRDRGDDDSAIARRLAVGIDEVAMLRGLTGHEVVNDDVDRAVDEVAGIIQRHRTADPASWGDGPPGGP